MSLNRTATEWADEVIRRIEADPNSDLAPVAVGQMITAQAFAEAIAAAEERGRRRGFSQGVEEAALIVEPLPTEAWHHDIRYDRECLVRSILALAPRDSAPKHKDWCALFGNPEAGKSCDCRGERK